MKSFLTKRVSIHCRWMKDGFNFDDDSRISQPLGLRYGPVSVTKEAT